VSILSYLLLFLLSTAQFAWSYSVVLKSGKKIEGTLVSDEGPTIVVRDARGVLISFKKDLLDINQMTLLNVQREASESLPSAASRTKPPGLVEIAAAAKRQRTGKAKNVSADDLEGAPQISIIGPPDEPPVTVSRSKETGREPDWEAKLWPLKKEVNRLREKRVDAEASCEQSRQKQFNARTRPSSKPVELLSTYKESAPCRKLAELDDQLQQAETRLENVREEARRAGASWRSLE
jgi:hypothetical protein